MGEVLREVGFSGVVDITVVAILIYGLLIWLKRTKRAAAILTGIIIVAAIYLLARLFNLNLTATVFQGFFAVILVALVVIFQEELRYLFEQVAQWSRKQTFSLRARPGRAPHHEGGEILARTLLDLARDRIGALVVLRGRDLLVRHLHGGQELRGVLSESILKSIFDPGSIGHDGAVVIEGDLIDKFGCMLPLSKESLASGTRHAAALGLSELTDALCLVVSEERGSISAARHGEMKKVTGLAEVRHLLSEFFEQVHPPPSSRPWREWLSSNLTEKALAGGLSLALWVVLVHESAIAYQTFTIPVEYPPLPSDLRMRSVEPPGVQVTLSGPRRAFLFMNSREVKLRLRSMDLQQGENTLNLLNSDLSFPSDLVLESIRPQTIVIHMARISGG